jgi:aromatic-L-amino-acid decarboxylase
MSPSILEGRWMVRVSIGVEATTRAHVEALWQLLQQQADKALNDSFDVKNP